jgi:hypothetical protein
VYLLKNGVLKISTSWSATIIFHCRANGVHLTTCQSAIYCRMVGALASAWRTVHVPARGLIVAYAQSGQSHNGIQRGRVRMLQWVACGPSIVRCSRLSSNTDRNKCSSRPQIGLANMSKLCFGNFLAHAVSVRTVKRPHQPVDLAATVGDTDTKKKARQKIYNCSGGPPKVTLP